MGEEGWSVEKQQGEVVISSKLGEHGRKIWLLEATVNITPETLEARIMDIDNITKWNTTLAEAGNIKTVSRDSFISYGGGEDILQKNRTKPTVLDRHPRRHHQGHCCPK